MGVNHGSLGAEPQPPGGKQGIGSRALDAEVTFSFFFKKYVFLSKLWPKLLLETHI